MKVIHTCRVKDYLAVDKIELHPDNPRTINPGRMRDLKASIIAKGFYEPILVWKSGGYVLSGNHRLKAIRELMSEGWKIGEGANTGKLPVVMIDEAEDVATQILFETNNRYAEWIDDRVRQALADADDETRKGFGFTDAEVDLYLRDAIDSANETLAELESSMDDIDRMPQAKGVIGEHKPESFDEDEPEIRPVSDDDLKQMVKNANLGVVFNKSLVAQIERRVKLLKQFSHESIEEMARCLVIESLEDECDEDIVDRYQAKQAE